MELPDNAAAVSRMQHYIEAHLDEEIALNKHANAAGYGAGHFSSVMNERGMTMPGSMIHLLLAKKVEPTGSALFYLGNIAPDAVTDWSQKEITHFRNLLDREAALKELAANTCPTDDFAKGVLLHLYFDWKWDILARQDFIDKEGADWFSKYREELSFASSYAFHNTDWARQVWHQMDICDISRYGNNPGSTDKQVKEFVNRNNKWHNENFIGPSKSFTPTLIDIFTTQIAIDYLEWIVIFNSDVPVSCYTP